MNHLSADTQKKLTNRVIVGAVLAAIGIPAIIIGGWFLIVFAVIALFFAVHEFTNARPHNRYKLAIHIFIMVMTFSIVFWIFIKNNLNMYGFDLAKWTFKTSLGQLEVSTIGIAVTVLVLFLSSIQNQNFKIDDATYLFTMVILTGISFQAFLVLRFFPIYSFDDWAIDIPWWSTSFLLIYVLIGNFMSDIGAYFVGILFGRSKMNPRISPKKTWEGFFGGVIFSFAFSLAFALLVSALGYPLLPFMTEDEWYWLVGLSLAMPLMANLGDFLFSAIKRHFDIKDFSTIFQSHGGMLDRIDSLLVTSLFVAIVVTFINSGWNFLA
ncbi:MAG TPA: phosphatidate cytidylyltransferase [Bacilli bacterium]|jgi:phosphatidate cytidylyltransferase|nr:phosphatidate cytidylyltransferase [Bacilli bacterium]